MAEQETMVEEEMREQEVQSSNIEETNDQMEVEANQEGLVSSPTRRKGKSKGNLRSVVWNHFKRIQIETGEWRALIYMIIIDELPFRFVEHLGFNYFMSIACPRFIMPSRRTVTRDSWDFYLDMKAKLKEVFMVCEGRICLTTDTWTSIKQMNYMCLTAHFIDRDWKLRKKIIGFRQVFSHKGTAIAEAIMAYLDEWGIDKVFSVTVDNASSNDTAIQHIKSLFDNRNTSVCDGQFLHVRCVAHIINLVVSDGLGEISTFVRKIREAVRYVKQSPARLQKFYDFVAVEDRESKKSLCLDVPTRWNSTFLMLQAAEKYETAFEMYALSDRQFRIDLISKVDSRGGITSLGVPDEDDWNDARRIMGFLKCFYDFTLKVSGSSYVTSNLFFPEVVILYRMLKMWEGSSDNQLISIANKMRRKYKKYWGDIEKMNKLLYIAVVLDPRRKMDFVAFTLSRVYPEENKGTLLADLVKKATYNLYDHYVKTSSVTPSTSSFPTIIEENILRKIDPVKEYKQYKEEVDGVIYKTELDKYLREEPDDTPDPQFNVLDWWKLNSHRYPILSQMARDVLAVPISTVSSESAFSTGGRVLDAFRSSLTPRIVEALICTQDWLRADSRAPSVEEDQLDIDKIDEELSKVLRTIGISDISLPHDHSTPSSCVGANGETSTLVSEST